jgi:ATP-binding cassette subfamily F protein 3
MEDVMKPVIALQDKMRQLEQDMKHLEGEELEKALELYNRYTHEFEYKNGYAYESEINGVLKGLGFSKEDFDRHTDTLSGGQKTRLSLGRLLLQKPDIIILDEPTNHLDMSSITWLEGFLTNYQGSVIIVSHDRYFLDKIVTKIVELDNSHGKVYNGNYTFYAEKRAEIRANMMKAYLNQQAEIKHQEEVITKLNQFNREKSIKRAESREKMLDRVERIEKPTEIASEMKLTLEPSIISGEDVLTIENLSKSFTQYTLFENLNIEIKRGEHVALIGGNGTGKTTILKIINKLVPKDAGTVILGSRVKIGYYDQEHQVLNNSNTIFDEISDAYPDLTNTRIRNVLAAFLFTGEDVFKKIGDLSGGEKGRVSLAKLMLSSANFLILDEPTNHLDITSKEILENALRNYTGTVLYVSHDRYFINQTATRIIELKDKVITNYIGNYDYYESHCDSAVQAGRAAFAPISDTSENTEVRQESQAKLSWKENKAEQARLRKKANDLKKLEDRIEAIETRINEIDKEFLIPENATNVPLLNELTNERNTLEEELNNLYEEWEELSQ